LTECEGEHKTEGAYQMHNRAGHCLGQIYSSWRSWLWRRENVEQSMWQLISYDEHSHKHRPIRGMLDLEYFEVTFSVEVLYSSVQKLLTTVKGY
jgi:hypothetical protein